MRALHKVLLLLGLLIIVPIIVSAQVPRPTPTFPPPPPSAAPFTTPVLFPTWTWTPTPLSTFGVISTDQTIEMGQEVFGVLENSAPSARYRFGGQQGQVVFVTVIPENYNYGFNVYLESLAGYQIYPIYQIANTYLFTLSEIGDFWIVVNTYAGSDFQWRVGYRLKIAMPEERSITYNETVEDVLLAEQPVNIYRFAGEQGDQIYISVDAKQINTTVNIAQQDVYGNRIQLTSSQYAPSIYREGRSQIDLFTLPTSSDYFIEVYNQYSGVDGEISVTLGRVSPTRIQYGDVIEAEFGAGDHAHYYSFAGEYGDTIDIQVISGDGLDTYLTLSDSSSPSMLMIDDDSGAGYDPEILRYFVYQRGTYTIQVQPFSPGSTGSYRLLVDYSKGYVLSEDPQPVQLDKTGGASLIFEVEAGETIRLNVRSVFGAVPYITVSQRDFNILNLSPGDVPEISVDFRAPNAGVVVVRVDRNYTATRFGSRIAEVWIERIGSGD